MSKYYTINGLKVRVSDHEPNHSMNRIRGRADVEFYTVDACGNKMSVINQIDAYCWKNDMDENLFSKVAADFPDEVKVKHEPIKKAPIVITEQMLSEWKSIVGRRQMKRQDAFCARNGIDWYSMTQGNYIVK